jgi:hypothetical protein
LWCSVRRPCRSGWPSFVAGLGAGSERWRTWRPRATVSS